MSFEKTVPLNEFITLQRGFDLPKGDRIAGQIPVIASTGVGGYHNEAKVEAPGVVIGRSGSIGGGQYITEDFWPLNTTLWIKDFKGHYPRYIYYLLRSIDFTNFNVGGAVPTLNRNHLSCVLVADIGYDNEKRIAEIVGRLDDKIELNRQTNQTLEQISQAIFKSWFVDFEPVKVKIKAKQNGQDPELAAMCAISGKTEEQIKSLDGAALQQLKSTATLFPDALIESELGEIPEGWEVKSMDDLSVIVAMGPFGSNIKVSTFVEDGIPVVSGQHLKGIMLIENEFNFVTLEHANKLNKANVQRGDVVFTHAGSIGQVAYIPDNSKYERYVLSQRQFYMRPDQKIISPLFIVNYFKSHLGQHNLLANASQVGVPSISRPVSNLRKIEAVVPGKHLSDVFHNLVNSMYNKTSKNKDEIDTLETIRNSLLPKLLSGEININNAA